MLSLNPEYVFHPSFQLSFIAVLSLIVGYEFHLKNPWILGNSKGILSSIRFYVVSNIYSSFLASIMTAPVVINQFYIFSTYSILMNLIAVPIMSFFLMPLSIISLLFILFSINKYILKLLGFFVDIIINLAKFVNTLPGAVIYFGYITKLSIVIFLFGFFWFCLWRTRWRFLGFIIMIISLSLMFNSPKPSFIFDMDSNIVGLKNKYNILEIYADKMPEFNRVYWANWFGQVDAEIFALQHNVFTTTEGQKIIINYKIFPLEEVCERADIYINTFNNTKCKGDKITISKDFLEKTGIVTIFCNFQECAIKANLNQRFKFK